MTYPFRLRSRRSNSLGCIGFLAFSLFVLAVSLGLLAAAVWVVVKVLQWTGVI